MKKHSLATIFLGIIMSIVMVPSFMFADNIELKNNSKYFQPWASTANLTDTIHKKIPEQENELDNVTSKYSCAELSLWRESNYTITKTLCFIKEHIHDYLQYAVYVWLVWATIFLIWNWFKIVISQEKEKQIGIFTKNLKYIIFWVILITCFYMIIDAFVSIVNLITN